ncbi:uncharacterized protein C8Q71DRAFT_296335 [Rhodofomes roseus]|uniref:C2H2-type domain-containing protein n=1 Tax=Rhodofomes roseus TaxID=34475 RepID=A0ABQ8K434_9APHY|nr:uncharacterized protein C8Q71DRAFT_296335 [Rhodofomes roseus]KAH9831636.1 hypothetical protein C8Q71DRAFT_296335 [Rhodofomes roseus]
MRRRAPVYQTSPPNVINVAPVQQTSRHVRTRTQSGPLASGTRPRPSSPRPLHWRAGVYFGTPNVAYAHETGHRPQPRPRPQYGSIASRWSPPKFATAPHPSRSARRPAHSRRPTDAQVIAARYRTQKPLPPTPVSSTAGLSVGPGDSLFVHPPSTTAPTSIGSFPDPRNGGAPFKPRVEERYMQEAYPQMMAAWYEGHNFIRCPRPRCREAYPTLLDMAWHLQLHDLKSRHIHSYGWPATPHNRPPQTPPPNRVFEVDLTGYYPRFSFKRVKKTLGHLLCLLTCTRCCSVCQYDP